MEPTSLLSVSVLPDKLAPRGTAHPFVEDTLQDANDPIADVGKLELLVHTAYTTS